MNTPIYDELWMDYFAREHELEVVQLRRKPWWTRLKEWATT